MSIKKFFPRTADLFRFMFAPGSPAANVPLVFFVITIAMVLQIPASLLIRSGFVSVGAIANEIVAMLLLPIAFIFFLRMDRGMLLPFRRLPIASVFAVVILTVGADIIIDYLTSASEIFFPLPADIKNTYDRVMAASTAPEIAWKFFILCALPAFCEEVFFRGFCQTSLAAKWGKRTALIAVAFVFAAMHGNPWYIHLYFLLGLLIGFVFYTTEILWAPVICHLINNAWTLFNHLRGFRFAIDSNFGWKDIGFICAGIILTVLGSWFLLRNSIHRANPDFS